MAGYRKLGRTSSQRKALLRNQVTDLLYYGKIITTEAKAKEIRKIAEGIIALGIKECNNFDTVTVTAKVARKDKDGKRRRSKRISLPDFTQDVRCRRLCTRSQRFLQMLRVVRMAQRQLMFLTSYWMSWDQSMLSVTAMVVTLVS